MNLNERTIKRFWSKVDVKSECECWQWKGCVNRKDVAGYGRIFVNGRNMPAHRVSLVIATGSNPQDKQTLHSCDNKLCVNPSHLRWGTAQENMREKSERHPTWRKWQREFCYAKRKLNQEQVEELRKQASEGESRKSLAIRFGMSTANVGYILRGQRYAVPTEAPKVVYKTADLLPPPVEL